MNEISRACTKNLSTSVVTADVNLRRRILAELWEVRDELQRYGFVINHPIPEDADPLLSWIFEWYTTFMKALNNPERQMDRYSIINEKKIIDRFMESLEKAFINPINSEEPFNDNLFGEYPHPIVRFVIAKMRTPHSLFYSESVYRAALKKEEVEKKQEGDSESQFQVIEAIQKQRELQQNESMQELVQLEQFYQQMEISVLGPFADMDRKMKQSFAELKIKIQESSENDKIKREPLLIAIDHLQKGIQNLQEKKEKLNAEIERMNSELYALQRAEKELEIEVNELERKAMEEKKNGLSEILEKGLFMAASMLATWGASQALSGFKIIFSNGPIPL